MNAATLPQVGDIWAARFKDRRVRVMRIWSSGRVALKTVTLLGTEWQTKKGGMSSTCDPQWFARHYRPLVRAS